MRIFPALSTTVAKLAVFECSGGVSSATAVPLIRSLRENALSTSSEIFTLVRDLVDWKAQLIQSAGLDRIKLARR